MLALTRVWGLLFLAILFGCSSSTDGFLYQPVSGEVRMDGEPLPKATVVFVPMGEGLNTGRPSVAETDESGAFVLQATNGTEGAVVGEHVVSISTGKINQNTDEVIVKEIIPPRYNHKSDLRFVVPKTGTSDANFDLESK